jgi:hypothetical protein
MKRIGMITSSLYEQFSDRVDSRWSITRPRCGGWL